MKKRKRPQKEKDLKREAQKDHKTQVERRKKITKSKQKEEKSPQNPI